MRNIPRLVLSAIRGGMGKTTLSLGIVAAWRKQGNCVAVFKKGPDFIDAGWLGAAAGKVCYNLDLFMMDHSVIVNSFFTHTVDSSAALIEGNRGLYDGMDESGTYSTANLAKLLKTPVVLIVDGTKTSATAAAVVLGCQQYDPAVELKGIILNNVSPGRHETVIRNAVEQRTGIPVVGSVPRQRQGDFPERHMGLMPFQEHPEVERAISGSLAVAEKYLDLEALWRIASSASVLEAPLPTVQEKQQSEEPVRIGVIRDTAFQFYYPDNLEAIELAGGSLHEINALKDVELPELDALYIGGGFPETHAAELAENKSFCASLRSMAVKGLPIYAECGGLIYLGRSLTVGDKQYPMSCVLPIDFVLEKRPQAHGYTELTAGKCSPFLDNGVVIRGHEFHYSRIANLDNLPAMAYTVQRGGGINGTGDGIVQGNILAAYTHIHALGTPEWAGSLVKKACMYRNSSKKAV